MGLFYQRLGPSEFAFLRSARQRSPPAVTNTHSQFQEQSVWMFPNLRNTLLVDRGAESNPFVAHIGNWELTSATGAL